MKRALILVDIQNDFLPDGPLGVPKGNEIIPFVIKLMQMGERYDLIAVSQDWHPAGHGSFASAHSGAEPFQIGTLGGLPQVYWPDHCVQETDGALLVTQVSDALNEITKKGRKAILIKKGLDKEVDSYSAFFDNARKCDTGLHRALKSYEIEEVDIVGLAFDYCVKATALDAASLGYTTRILMEGTREIDSSAVDQLIKELKEAGVECVKSL